MRHIFMFLLCFPCFLLFSLPTQACGRLFCNKGYFLPRDGKVPENAPGFLWHPPVDQGRSLLGNPTKQHIKLVKKEHGEEKEVDFSIRAIESSPYYLIIPTVPWRQGQHYTLHALGFCHSSRRVPENIIGEFVITQKALFPEIQSHSGDICNASQKFRNCNGDVSYTVGFEFLSLKEGVAWKDYLYPSFRVDGKVYPSLGYYSNYSLLEKKSSYTKELPSQAVCRGDGKIQTRSLQLSLLFLGKEQSFHSKTIRLPFDCPGLVPAKLSSNTKEFQLSSCQVLTKEPSQEEVLVKEIGEKEPLGRLKTGGGCSCSSSSNLRNDFPYLLVFVLLFVVRRMRGQS